MIRILLSTLLFFSSLLAEYSSSAPFVMGSLSGQLGNQLFIIAATVSLALDNGAFPIFPDLGRCNKENIPLNYQYLFSHLTTTFPQFGRISYYYHEPHYHYAPIPYKPNICLLGYFQSEKYFAHHKQEILNLFAPTQQITHYLNEKYGELLKHPLTVSVHVRFYAEGAETKISPNIGSVYYEKALSSFPENARFLVFSNQMDRCKKLLSGIKGDFHFIEGESHYHDFYLMSLCKHNIISNSSFSWWAAYLNLNLEKKVIAPYPWLTRSCGFDFKDVIPNDWTVISYE